MDDLISIPEGNLTIRLYRRSHSKPMAPAAQAECLGPHDRYIARPEDVRKASRHG